MTMPKRITYIIASLSMTMTLNCVGCFTDQKQLQGQLLRAVESDSLIEVRAILDSGANPNPIDPTADSALILASARGNIDVARLLIRAGADVNHQIKTNKKTALIVAVSEGHIALVKLLLEHKANVDTIITAGRSAFHWSVVWKKDRITLILLKKTRNINSQDAYGNTVLHRAAYNGSKVVVSALLAAGARTNVANNEGKTARTLARDRGYGSIVKLLAK